MANDDGGALDALRAVLRSEGGLALDGDAEAEVLAYMQRTGLLPDNPQVIAFVDLLRVRADIAATTANAIADGLKRGLADALDEVRASQANTDATAAIVAVRGTLDTIVERKPVTHLTVQPTTAAALYSSVTIIIASIASLVTWSLTQTYDAAKLSHDAPLAAKLLETPGGRAATQLLRANGDGLALELSHCEHYLSGAKDAMRCDVWADGTNGTAIIPWSDRILDALLHFPAWPILALAALAAILYVVVPMMKKKPRATPQP